METHLVIISPKRSVSPVPHELTAATCIIVFLASFVEYLGVTVDLQHYRIAVCFNTNKVKNTITENSWKFSPLKGIKRFLPGRRSFANFSRPGARSWTILETFRGGRPGGVFSLGIDWCIMIWWVTLAVSPISERLLQKREVTIPKNVSKYYEKPS